MAARWVAVSAFALAVLAGLSKAPAVFAGPFAEVPAGHISYRDAALLAESGLWKEGAAPASGLCRYDFASGVLEAVRLLSGPHPAKELPRYTRVRLADALSRLAKEYEDVLLLFDESSKKIAEAAKGLESQPGPIVETSSVSPGAHLAPVVSADGADIPGAHLKSGGLGLTLGAVSPVRLTGGRLIDRLLTETALLSGVGGSPAYPGPSSNPGNISGVSLPSLDRVGGSVEYSLSDSLSLSLAYSALTSGGRLLPTPLSTRLKTLGVGIRISSATSLSLRYHLLERPERTGAPSPVRSLAETELLVRF